MDGKHSYAQVSDAVKEACMGLKTVNAPAESVFATFTKALSTSGQVGLDGATGQGQARYNNDMGRDQAKMVTGRKSKSETNKNNAIMGLFHTLDEELTDSLILTCWRHSKEDRRDFNKVLKRQEVWCTRGWAKILPR